MENVKAENRRLAAENERLSDREKILEMRVKLIESDNEEFLKKIDADQSEIDILKVKISELGEEKSRRDEQNKYYELKNKELEVAKAQKDHELYMLNRVVESILGKSVADRYEELLVEDLRAERQAEIERQMKDKGKGVEGSSVVTERALVPSVFIEKPVPISSVSGLFEEETPMEELIGDSDEEDDEEDNEDDEVVFSVVQVLE
ncbi:hypothetical protein Hdeb2414_s0102g00794091 [Helianthus debilis subsp. tardiflorus]